MAFPRTSADLIDLFCGRNGWELAGPTYRPPPSSLRRWTGAERVHIIGLVSDGVHSSLEHLKALIDLGAELGVPDLVVHAFTDGRDTLPHAGAGFLEDVEQRMASAGAGRIGSVGRYGYAMDRDKRAGDRAAGLRHAGSRGRHADTAGFRRRSRRLDVGELPAAFRDLEVIDHREAVVERGSRRRAVGGLVARRR